MPPSFVKVSDLFDIKYGHSLEFNKFEEDLENGVNFVSRTSKNNGISGKIKIPKNSKIEPAEGPLITVALGGSVLSTFLQLEPIVTGRDTQLLFPKKPMSVEEMLFYCTVIEANKWKYSYGRQANKTLKDLVIPKHIPTKWKGTINSFDFSIFKKPISKEARDIDFDKWGSFLIKDLFKITPGDYRIPKSKRVAGTIPLVTASKFNNGVSGFIKNTPYENKQATLFNSNLITLAKNGSVGETFFQPEPFLASNDIFVLSPKRETSPQVLAFISTIIKQSTLSRYSYGYKLNIKRIEDLHIFLPITNKNELDTEWIENFINSLEWSSIFTKN